MTKLEILNTALVVIGDEPLAFFNTDHPIVARFDHLFDSNLRAYLEKRDWTFASKTIRLSDQTDSDDVEYRYHYVLPRDVVKVRGVYLDSRTPSSIPEDPRPPFPGGLHPPLSEAELDAVFYFGNNSFRTIVGDFYGSE